MSTVTIDPENDFLYRALRVAVYHNLFVGIAYGIFVTFYAVSVHILVGRPGLLSSRPRMFMLAITTFTFILSLIGLVLMTALESQDVYADAYRTGGGIWPVTEIHIVSNILVAITFIMYILSDIICAWRVVVLWNKDKRVISILLLFTLGNIAAAGFVLFLESATPVTNLGDTVMIMVFPTLAINLLSTGLIGWKAWEHRVTVKRHLEEGTVSMRVEKIFAILIESGLVYCCFWILVLISAFVNTRARQLGLAMNDALLVAPGAYPTLIIILVSTKKSPIDYYSTHASGMQFANNVPSLGLHNQAGRVVPRKDEETGV